MSTPVAVQERDTEIHELRDENARLREALLRYGSHGFTCYLDERGCVCGLAALLPGVLENSHDGR